MKERRRSAAAISAAATRRAEIRKRPAGAYRRQAPADPIRTGQGRGGTADRVGFFIAHPRPGTRPRRRLYSGPASATSGAVRPMSDVTRILSAIEQGDPTAAEQLLPLVYGELRRLAAQKL